MPPANGHHQFAALAPQTAYGDVTKDAFTDAVAAVRGTVVDVERFAPNSAAVAAPASAVAKSGADAVFIAQGGVILRAIGPTLSLDGATRDKVKLLGTGPVGRRSGDRARIQPARQLVRRARTQCRSRFCRQVSRCLRHGSGAIV